MSRALLKLGGGSVRFDATFSTEAPSLHHVRPDLLVLEAVIANLGG
jgi:hypothetical protein